MDFHVLSTHSSGRSDDSPLQLISVELLAYYRRIEAEYLRLREPRYLRRRRGSDNTRTVSRNPAP
jgi:hypothetical protein